MNYQGHRVLAENSKNTPNAAFEMFGERLCLSAYDLKEETAHRDPRVPPRSWWPGLRC